MINRTILFTELIMLFFHPEITAQLPEIKWHFDTQSFAAGQAAAADIDDDGKLEIAFGCYRNDGSLYVLNAEDGSLSWKYQPHNPPKEGCNDVAILLYDINADHALEVIMASSCTAVTTCLNGKTGQIIWQVPTGGSDSPPTIGDIDGDGKLEILHGEFLGWVRCLDAETGSLKWRIRVNNNSWVQTAPTLVDLDDDGGLDFVVGTWHFDKKDSIYAFKGSDRKKLWATAVHDYIYHGTAVTDFNSDGKPELVFGSYNDKVYCLNGEDGTIQWYYTGKGSVACPVTLGDVDTDGSCDVVFTSWYETIALDAEGNEKWLYEIPGFSYSFRGISLADINNDVYPDAIFGTYSGHLICVDGKTGTEIHKIDLAADYGKTPFDINHQPLIADFDGDGTLDAFVVGGYGVSSPTIENNYGRAYMVSLGIGNGPDWLMFQRDVHRQSSLCLDNMTAVSETTIRQLEISPNPASNYVEIDLSNPHFKKVDSGLQTIHIFNAIGACVLSVDVDLAVLSEGKTRLDISALPSGLYFFKIIDLSGKCLVVR